MAHRQLTQVGDYRGAPMGRPGVGELPPTGHALRLRRLKWVDYDYDEGGAYWGAGSDKKESIYWLYSEETPHFARFYRATSAHDALHRFRKEAGHSGHSVAFDKVEPSKHAYDFLEALLFSYPEAEGDEEAGFNPEKVGPLDFEDNFINSVESFITGFEMHLSTLPPARVSADGIPVTLRDIAEFSDNSFGGNIFWSLSAFGCGFDADGDEDGVKIHEALVAYVGGDESRFSDVSLHVAEGGITLEVLPEYQADAVTSLFATINSPVTD